MLVALVTVLVLLAHAIAGWLDGRDP